MTKRGRPVATADPTSDPYWRGPRPPHPTTLDGSHGRTLAHMGGGIEDDQEKVEEALERLRRGLAGRVKVAAMPNWLQILIAERRIEFQQPLMTAARRLALVLTRAQSALDQTESIAANYPDTPIHGWIRMIRAGLGTFDHMEFLRVRVASSDDLASLRSTELPTRRVRPAADDEAIRTRVMPHIRRAVYSQIEPAVRRHLAERAEPITLDGKTLREDGAAYALTAAYLEAFFPKWGPTTSRSVQTAVRNAGLSKSRRR